MILTRTTDRYLTLEERTAIANTKNADLFISVHTNAAKNKEAYGIETYFLNLATDNDAILVAARENATSEKNISDLQSILNDLMHNAKVNESSRLAGHVQSAMVGGLSKKYSSIKDKKVKQAPFYVLLGTRIPRDSGGDLLHQQFEGMQAPDGQRLPGGSGRFHRERREALYPGNQSHGSSGCGRGVRMAHKKERIQLAWGTLLCLSGIGVFVRFPG